MVIAGRSAQLFLGLIALGLTIVEFIPLFLGKALWEITFLGIHVGAATALTFLMISRTARRKADDPVHIADVAMALAALACAAYFATQGGRVAERIEGVDPVYGLDYAFGILLILLLLEACRRVAGLVLMLVALVFIAYVFLGPWLPGGQVVLQTPDGGFVTAQ